MKLVIDASNIIAGGGLTHLKEFIKHANPSRYDFEQVSLWAPNKTLDKVPDKRWLKKRTHQYLNNGYLHRFMWRKLVLKSTLDENTLLFIPGTGYVSGAAKVVTMCQNLLPIQKSEMDRFWPSLKWVRYFFLRSLHFYAFKKADGVIFLNEHSLKSLPETIQREIKSYAIIPHGLNSMFKSDPKEDYNLNKQVNLVYVSRINLYKHQWSVAKAICELNKEGYNLTLRLIGGMEGPGRDKLDKVLKNNPDSSNSIYLFDEVPYEELPQYYKDADIFIFASSCETFGMILLEAMGMALPITCSNSSSMQNLLEDGGLYFDPEDVNSIKGSIKKYIKDKFLRKEMGLKAQEISQGYSWGKTANRTLQYLSEVYNQ